MMFFASWQKGNSGFQIYIAWFIIFAIYLLEFESSFVWINDLVTTVMKGDNLKEGLSKAFLLS